ncbi:Cytosine deaminase related metal-dependent hydrolase [Methanonatronarchaeum thermophilum]|uniref:5-methylthioadenosine/S-adenosylhomocysteine deaminase n=1 Tax=Methanonatronarchaeum thermophilum TaxID=1927129 RepID=A0A1Y3GAP7_9EURY|nr:amidohydrolase [Methanonatronarchaeum thermophilum]OUJ18489.1 Cytosine deaminase related metal-dependent hydrolase [Methanonatronarchaeum thermophilum]
MEVDLILEDGVIVPVTEGTFRGSIAIDDGEIVGVGENQEILNRFKGDRLDLDGSIVIPGLINTHTHLAMTLLRGVADDLPLDTWLEDYIWPLEGRLQSRHVYAGSLLGCLEMIKNGITFFADMYVEQNMVAKAVEETGLRAALSFGLVSINKDEQGVKEELEEGIEVYQKLAGAAGGRVITTLGPHSPSTCSKDFLRKLRDSVGDCLIQIHLAETQQEFDQVMEEHGVSPTELIHNVGLLNENTVCAHAVHLTQEDIDLIARSGATVSHNPTSNMKLASGVAPIPDLLEKDVTVALGTDGAASNNSLDLFGEMKLAALLHKSSNMDPTAVPAIEVLKMATINGAKAFGLEDSLGSIEVGKKADLTVIDSNSPNMTPKHNVVSNLVYSTTNREVETVIIDGEIVMKDREIQSFNEKKVIKQAEKMSKDIIEK